jgi:hypothetical protein
MTDHRSRVVNAALILAVTACSVQAGQISISSLPVVSSSVLVADETTQHTVTLTASGVAGYEDIRSVRVLFNMTESGSNPSKGRGYLAWGQIDSDITIHGGTWVLADAVGGGRWAYRTDAWGGATYITPIGCSMSTGGSPTGGSGTRTVAFTFTVKPAWAANPLINDADAWAMTARSGPNDSDYCKVGWLDNPTEFVVVATPCTGTAVTPLAPVISSPGVSTLDVSVDPADSATDLFAIRISPPLPDADSPIMSYEYVQADGTIGGSPVWQTRAAWGTTTVVGLDSSTAYTFRVCAFNADVGTCPTAWSAPASATTLLRSHAINCADEGVVIHKGVHGMDAQSKMFAPIITDYTLDVSWNTSMRAGGDGYNWKTRTAQWGSNRTSILEYLRYARDRNSYLQMLVNTRGIGTGNDNEWQNVWVYTDQTPETLAALAADCVYYCNVLVQNRRQGDVLTPDEQSLLDSMDWGTDDKLLAPGEDMVPTVTWWEIGNEPEGPYPPPVLTPEDYANRYSVISNAMIAQDPTIKVGPGCMTANNGNAWLDAVLANPDNRVDFIAYHPYGNLFYITRDMAGGTLDPLLLGKGVAVQKRSQANARQKIIDRLIANNRPADTSLILSEWNSASWQGSYYYGLGQTVAQGLGIAENVFSFIEMDILAAQYWDQPNIPNKIGVEIPGFKVFKALQAYLPDRLIDSLVDGCFRLYTTRDSRYQRLILWAINLAETQDKPVRIHLQSFPGPVTITSITRRTLAAYSDETSLVTRSYDTELVGWTETDLTDQIDPSDFTMTFDSATLTMLIFELDRPDAPIVLNPTHFMHTAYLATGLSDDVFTVASGGADTLSYSVEPDVPWLNLEPVSGSSSGEADPITVSYDLAGLSPGEYVGTIKVRSNDAYNSPQVVTAQLTIQTVKPDMDRDGDVDQSDFGLFQACLSGPGNPPTSACEGADLDGDSDVDHTDFGIFQGCMSGANIPAAPACAD